MALEQDNDPSPPADFAAALGNWGRFRSHMPGILWPAIPNGLALPMLSLLYQFEESEHWPLERLRAAQFQQLANLVEHAFRNVPYYRETLREAGYEAGETLDEPSWRALPILSRAEAMHHAKRLIADRTPVDHGERRPFMFASGAAGQASELALIFREAMALRDHLWHDRDLGGKLCVLRPTGSGEPLRAESWSQGAGAAFTTGPCAVFDSKRAAAEQTEWLSREAPDYLLALPSALRRILEHPDARAARPARLRGIGTLGEIAPDDLRGLAREIWGVPLAATYAPIECGLVALQCREAGRYHAMCEAAAVEILDDRGEPCTAGELGRMVVTPLHNLAMPLLRYEIGDRAAPGAACECGRTLPVLARIVAAAA